MTRILFHFALCRTKWGSVRRHRLFSIIIVLGVFVGRVVFSWRDHLCVKFLNFLWEFWGRFWDWFTTSMRSVRREKLGIEDWSILTRTAQSGEIFHLLLNYIWQYMFNKISFKLLLLTFTQSHDNFIILNLNQ